MENMISKPNLEMLLRYIKNHHNRFAVLGESSFVVKQFDFEGKEYVVKLQDPRNTGESPFWKMMQEVFGSDFASQRRNMAQTYSELARNPHIPIARFVTADETSKCTVFERAYGHAWKPDIFPKGKEISYQLGMFIGYNHQKQYPSYGMLDSFRCKDIQESFLEYIRKRIALAGCGSDPKLIELYTKAKEQLYKGDITQEYCMVMADISGNQFLYHEDGISACVDLDGYVVAPRAWEIAVLQYCVPEREAFRKGYEVYQELPVLDEVARLFGYIMSV